MKSILLLFTFSVFHLVFSQNPEYDWGLQFGGIHANMGKANTSDNSGNVYSIGWFNGVADFDPGPDSVYFNSGGSANTFIQKLDGNKNILWAKALESTSSNYGSAIDIDDEGNIVLTGFFRGTIDLDPGVNVQNRASLGQLDVYIIKLNSEGEFLWGKTFGGQDYVRSYGATFDENGNVLLVGAFKGTCDFDPSNNQYELTSAGNEDIFIQKLDINGSFLWAKHFGSNEIDNGLSIATDENNNVFTTGFFVNSVDFDPGIGSNIISTNGSSNSFILKLDSNGEFVWVKQIEGASSCKGYSIHVDKDGNLLSTGLLQATADFDPSIDNYNLTSSGSQDIYIQKLNNDGDFLWAKQIGDFSNDEGYSVTSDLAGNIYVSGHFYGTVNFDSEENTVSLTSNGSLDVFILKLKSEGQFIWARNVGGPNSDHSKSISVNNYGHIFITGFFSENIDLDPNSNVENFTCSGELAVFVLKLIQTEPVNTNEISDPIMASVFPNPCSESISISLNHIYSNVEISLVNSLGRIVQKKNVNEKKDIQLPLNAPSGVYFLTIKTEKKIYRYKLIKN